MDNPIADPDMIISCRVRVLRNLAEYPFLDACSEAHRVEIQQRLRAACEGVTEVTWVAPGQALPPEAERWRMRLLRDLMPEDPEIGLDSQEQETRLWLLAQDHLMIEVERTDHDLAGAWSTASEIDDHVERQLPIAFSRRWGYLTSSPADVGTGLRVSALLHLPALAITGQIGQVFRSLPRANLVGRCLPAEPGAAWPSPPAGEGLTTGLFRIGNQATLGFTEEELIQQVSSVLPMLIRLEQQARRSLLEQEPGLRPQFRVAVHKLVRLSRQDPLESPLLWLALLSQVRLGIALGMIPPDPIDQLSRGLWLSRSRQQLHQAVAEEQYGKAAQLRDQIQMLQSQIDSQGGER